MYIAKVLPTKEELLATLEIVKEEIVVLKSEVTNLEQQQAKTPKILQILGKWFGFGPTNKLDWVRFKLKVKTEEMASNKAQYTATT